MQMGFKAIHGNIRDLLEYGKKRDGDLGESPEELSHLEMWEKKDSLRGKRKGRDWGVGTKKRKF